MPGYETADDQNRVAARADPVRVCGADLRGGLLRSLGEQACRPSRRIARGGLAVLVLCILFFALWRHGSAVVRQRVCMHHVRRASCLLEHCVATLAASRAHLVMCHAASAGGDCSSHDSVLGPVAIRPAHGASDASRRFCVVHTCVSRPGSVLTQIHERMHERMHTGGARHAHRSPGLPQAIHAACA